MLKLFRPIKVAKRSSYPLKSMEFPVSSEFNNYILSYGEVHFHFYPGMANFSLFCFIFV